MRTRWLARSPASLGGAGMAVPHYLHGEARHLRGEEAAAPPPIGIAVASSPCSVPPVPIDRVLGASWSGRRTRRPSPPVARGFAAALEGAPVLVLIDPRRWSLVPVALRGEPVALRGEEGLRAGVQGVGRAVPGPA